MFLDTTDRVRVEDLLRGIVVLSGNDACAVIAEALSLKATADTLPDLLADADLVLDGCDDFPTRFAVNRAAIKARIPLVSDGIGPLGIRGLRHLPMRTPWPHLTRSLPRTRAYQS